MVLVEPAVIEVSRARQRLLRFGVCLASGQFVAQIVEELLGSHNTPRVPPIKRADAGCGCGRCRRCAEFPTIRQSDVSLFAYSRVVRVSAPRAVPGEFFTDTEKPVLKKVANAHSTSVEPSVGEASR